jgi:hypothetical protein
LGLVDVEKGRKPWRAIASVVALLKACAFLRLHNCSVVGMTHRQYQIKARPPATTAAAAYKLSVLPCVALAATPVEELVATEDVALLEDAVLLKDAVLLAVRGATDPFS